jgi:hypothetical protein
LSTAKVRARSRSVRSGRSRAPIASAGRISGPNPFFVAVTVVAVIGVLWWFHARYTVSFQSPVVVRLQLPFVIAERLTSTGAERARSDQHGHRLSAWQEYACRKFGDDCRVALAIQRAENPQGKCEIYHYNTDGTLDWGYFQINTVHLKRPGLNLRDLLDCRANIDFAYQLYRERGGFTPWSTYNSGLYRKYIATE